MCGLFRPFVPTVLRRLFSGLKERLPAGGSQSAQHYPILAPLVFAGYREPADPPPLAPLSCVLAPREAPGLRRCGGQHTEIHRPNLAAPSAQGMRQKRG